MIKRKAESKDGREKGENFACPSVKAAAQHMQFSELSKDSSLSSVHSNSDSPHHGKTERQASKGQPLRYLMLQTTLVNFPFGRQAGETQRKVSQGEV